MIQMSRLATAVAATLLAAGTQAAPKGEVLVLLSSEHQLPLQDGKRYATGYYLNEFGVPADQLLKAGYKLVLVTPRAMPQASTRVRSIRAILPAMRPR